MELLKRLFGHPVEILAGIAMIVLGALLQSFGSKSPDGTFELVIGGLLIAFGGILLAWIASKILSVDQAAQAAQKAEEDFAKKLDNLSRGIGQAAGQISQAVEQYELNKVNPTTGFALVSQANRIIYGQVNEIAVLRGEHFDAGALIDTANKLDELARQLSNVTGTGSTADAVRKQLADVRQSLSTDSEGSRRAFRKESVTCPYCNASTDARLGSLPGDTAVATCRACGESFNTHRSSAGIAFVRARYTNSVNAAESNEPTTAPPITPPIRFEFPCPSCNVERKLVKDGKGDRFIMCTACLAWIKINPDTESVALDCQLRRVDVLNVEWSGSRPNSVCPDCGGRINMFLYSDVEFFGFCASDRVALVTPRPLVPIGASQQ